jgi:hypothetical protein
MPRFCCFAHASAVSRVVNWRNWRVPASRAGIVTRYEKPRSEPAQRLIISRIRTPVPAGNSQLRNLFFPVFAIRFRLLPEAALSITLFERNLRGVL